MAFIVVASIIIDRPMGLVASTFVDACDKVAGAKGAVRFNKGEHLLSVGYKKKTRPQAKALAYALRGIGDNVEIIEE